MTNSAPTPTLTLDATTIAKDLATRISEVSAERDQYRARKAAFREAGRHDMLDFFQSQIDQAGLLYQELYLQANRWGIVEMVDQFIQEGEVA